jgi:hypothetical protein
MYESQVRRPDGLTFLGIALAGIAVLGILLALAAFGSAALADQQTAFFESIMEQQSAEMGDDSVAEAMRSSQAEILAVAERWRPIELGMALLKLLLASAMLHALSKVWKVQPGSTTLLNKVLATAIVFAIIKLGKDILQFQSIQPMMSATMDSMMADAGEISAEGTAFAGNIGQVAGMIGIGFSALGAAIKSIFYMASIFYLRGSKVQDYLAAANDDGMGGGFDETAGGESELV